MSNISNLAMNEIVDDTIKALECFSDPKYIPFIERVAPTKQRVLGIRTPELRKVLKELKKKTASLSTREQIDLAIKLVETDIFEVGQLGYEYLGKNNKLLTELTSKDLKQLNRNLDNWATVDIFGVYIHGKVWRMGILSDSELLKLAKHENFWQRRLAVVSTISLNQKSNGGIGDPERTLLICKVVVEDYHDLIVKALSWALRELSKREPEIVKSFIDKYQDILHRRVLREVNNKLLFGKKNID